MEKDFRKQVCATNSKTYRLSETTFYPFWLKENLKCEIFFTHLALIIDNYIPQYSFHSWTRKGEVWNVYDWISIVACWLVFMLTSSEQNFQKNFV